ncbi:MAG: SPOR domain-containing protein, partial [Ignavibacteria bacterium]|nr:SPOR domain-containing protein [Ignavibacteria bacterium]
TIEFEEADEQKPEFYKSEKKRNLIPFVVFPLLIIIASVALYWYLEFYKKNETEVKPTQIVLKSENAKVVARSFDLPVSYPYLPKINQTTISETGTLKIDEPNITTEKIEDKKTEQKKPEEKLTVKEIPNPKNTDSNKPVKVEIPTGISLNVGDNIFKYGNYFVVQVASYRASSISENEAGKFRNKGYNAFVEAAEIPNRGTWYRVRVGNFSTREEAQNFISKNIR